VRPYVCAGTGFLLAVVWFDLMHDVLALRAHEPADVLTIARYYRRVTTDARPMNRLVAAVMVGTLTAAVVEVAQGKVAAWASLALLVLAISFAAARTVRNAVSLGAHVDRLTNGDDALARSIGRDHVVCFCALTAALAIQLAA